MKSFLVLAALLPLVSSLRAEVPLVESPLPGDKLQATVHRLSNGLTVYLSPNHQQPRVSANIVVRAGSKNDPPDSTGMAHYLEHMLFKGSSSLGTLDYEKERPHLERILALYEKHFTATDEAERERIYKDIDAENIESGRYAIPNELAKVYRQLGVRGLNAFTSNDQTVYVSNFPANRAEAWATVEAERFAHPVFRLFQGELETVYEEKNRSLDNAGRILSEALDKQLYKNHPYGRTTLGSIEHLKNPSLAKMYEFYSRYYVPNNMAIVLSGDFEPAAMLALLEKHLGVWKPKPLPAPGRWPLVKPRGEERVEVKYEAEEVVELVWPGPPALAPDAEALRVAGLMLCNGHTGIIDLTLSQALKVKSASAGYGALNEAGEFGVWAVPKLGQTLEEARALLLEAVAALKSGAFSEEDLRGAVTNFEVGEKYNLESDEARVSRMTTSFVRDEPWAHNAASLERLRRVTKADVLRVARRYLGDDRVLAYRRKGKPELPSIAKPHFTKLELDSRRSSAFAEKVLALPSEPLTPRWIEEGRDYSMIQTPSGPLIATKNPFNDLFSVNFRFERGLRQERELCPALSLLNLAGAGALSAEDYKRKLYRLGTSVSYTCGDQDVTVTVSGLDENLEESLALLRARFAEPAVSSETLSKLVDVQIGAHRDNKKNPGYVLFALEQFAERGKDSRVLAEPTDAELRGLRLERLQELIRGVFGFRRRVAYVGNRPPAEIAKLLAGAGPFRDPPARLPLRLRRPARAKIYFTHRDMVQAQASVYAPDGRLEPERVVDYAFYSDYVGGGMSSLIFQEVREARSLAYAAGGGYARGSYSGDDNKIFGNVGSQADKAVDAVALLSQLLRRPPLEDKRFAETKRTIEEGYRDNPTPFRYVPGTVWGWEDEGITGGDPRPRNFEKSLRYRPEDLTAFDARFRDAPVSVSILGHRDRVDLKGLKKMGDFEEKTLEEIFPY